jgi:hypothetical protein
MNKESNITALLSAAKTHQRFSRSNRFFVSINGPASVGDYAKDLVEYMAESATLPGRTIATIDHQDAFEGYKMPYTFIDDEVTVTFLLTDSYLLKLFFDDWQSKVFDSKTYSLGYKNEFVGTVEIYQLDANNEKTYGSRLINAFPVTISEVELSTGSENTVSRFTVTFAYDRFEIVA